MPRTCLDATTEGVATRWARIAAALRAAAERMQDVDGESAASLEQEASDCRILLRSVVATGLNNPWCSEAELDFLTSQISGQLLRDAYASCRAGGAL